MEGGNGEAHRQEVGVISSGSYQRHFLYTPSEPLKKSRGRKRRDEVKDGESKKKTEKKNRGKTSSKKRPVPLDPVFTRESGKEVTAEHERNLDE